MFEVARVGGKAANLSRLARLYHRVPDGFSLPVTVMAEAHPTDLRDEITVAIADLMACHRLPELVVAVRSSAVDEDGAAASFAGQHETYLNIVGADAIIEAVGRCWESARSERALEYRRQQGLSVERPQLAVLVQQLVASDVSAVAFSANPVTGNRDEIMINASWGLGESIVGGTVTPDTFIVRKLDFAVIKRAIADKQQMTVSAPGGCCICCSAGRLRRCSGSSGGDGFVRRPKAWSASRTGRDAGVANKVFRALPEPARPNLVTGTLAGLSRSRAELLARRFAIMSIWLLPEPPDYAFMGGRI